MEISEFRRLFKEMITSKELQNQEEVNEAYKSFVEDFSYLQPIKYFEDVPKNAHNTMFKTLLNFKKRPLSKVDLQKKNILLSPKLYRQVMLAEKQITNNEYVVYQGEDRDILELSQLQVAHDDKNQPLFFVKIIRIKLNEEFLKNSEVRNNVKAKIKNIVEQGVVSSLDDVSYIFNRSKKYSIQLYYLPEGYANRNCLKNANLLFRIEKSFYGVDKGEQVVHNNHAMPNYYNYIYPTDINSVVLLREPHFHFLEGVSSLSKQDDVEDKKNKIGAGYALPCCNVRGYLMKLKENKYKSDEDKNFFLTNDFGLPFLNLYKQNPKIIDDILEAIESFSIKDNQTDEILKANNLVDLISCSNKTAEVIQNV